MNNKFNSFLTAMIALLVVGGATLLLLPQDENVGVGTGTSVSDLHQVEEITHAHGLAVDIVDPTKVYIATHHGLLQLKNEKELFRVGESMNDYMGFSPHPTEASTFFSSGHPSHGGNMGFLKTIDGGVTWSKVSDGLNGPVDFHAMAVSAVNPNLVYGWHQGSLQRSLDQGKTWTIVNSEVLPVQLTTDTKDESTVYAATPRGSGVMVSRDMGVTWSSLSPAIEGGVVLAIAVHHEDPKIIFIFSEKLGGLGKSLDGGETWNKVFGGIENEVVTQIAISKSEPNTVYVLSKENKLFKSMSAGDSWVLVR